MASYKPIVITKKGHALMSKLIAGTSALKFTKVVASDYQYSDSSLEGLTSLANQKQTSEVSQVKRIADASVLIQVGYTNENLKTGYYMRTLGIYAKDPDEGEILYAVMSADIAPWMPPYNGLTKSSATFNLSLTVGNSENVSIELIGSAFVTVDMFNSFKQEVGNKLKVYMTSGSDGVYINYES